MSNFGGLIWDNTTRALDISGGNINIKDSVHFKDHNTTFNGSYNTLANKPTLTQGTTGTQGTKGVTGSGGSTGSQGTKGDTGSGGSTGSQGTKGDTGSGGSSGSQGTKGDTGSGGSTGSQGTTGTTGNTGNQGSQGATGSSEGGGIIDLINGGKSIGNLTSITYDGAETLTFIAGKANFSVRVQPAEFGGR